MNKILAVISSIGILFSAFALPTFAAGKSAPKATGTIGWINTGNGAQATDSFDAQQTSEVCQKMWNMSGEYTFHINYLGNDYFYSVNLDQNLNGTLNDSYLPGGAQELPVTGTLTGNTFKLYVVYPGQPWGTRTFVGSIDSSGNLSGSWSDDGSDNASGTWLSSSGVATSLGASGCSGKGTFTYSDTSGIFYAMNVKYVNVDKTTNAAWFSGPTVSGNFGIGSWIFIKVVDNGQPGINNDQIWGEGGDMTEAQAQDKVASMANPLGGPFTINDGNLVVHN
ncbi:MAG TPA: hypothetical protein VF189_04105 [Patescibacteria group bacterium]